MNYHKIYTSIIDNRKTNPYSGYTEKHHILPKCMGGTDIETNIVRLSAREHYICHILLVKMYKHPGLINAAVLMGAQVGATSRVYAILREKLAIQQSMAQSKENNSQFGTRWIFSEKLNICKKIRADQDIPEGYTFGRKSKENPITKICLRRQANIEKYTYLYKIYSELGWEELVKTTGYNKSKANFVQMCKKYVEEFIPQNGKIRGAKQPGYVAQR